MNYACNLHQISFKKRRDLHYSDKDKKGHNTQKFRKKETMKKSKVKRNPLTIASKLQRQKRDIWTIFNLGKYLKESHTLTQFSRLYASRLQKWHYCRRRRQHWFFSLFIFFRLHSHLLLFLILFSFSLACIYSFILTVSGKIEWTVKQMKMK